jgi:precorrin-6B C5,15-methyltransferase / cobalt-precorrin-6B C5,C15-methyltransferase
MTSPAGAWLSIVGIGEDGLDGVSAAGRRLIEGADLLAGGERHLALIPDDRRERLPWPTPFSAGIDQLLKQRGRRVCVLASGDPMSYGIGATLARRIPPDEMIVVPAPGAFDLACARMGWARAEVETLTLHGRPLALLHAYLQPGARLLILSENGETPAAVAGLLARRGYGQSRITVLEHMGGPLERRRDWPDSAIADLNTIAVECIADPGAPLLPRTPGLLDEAFHHDGQLTKREVRAATLAALAPVPGQLLWDVGAGCGSIAIEWMRHHPTCRAVAVEPRRDRLALIAANAESLGCPQLSIVEGKAPAALTDLGTPDAIFIGGGITSPGLFDTCWQALPPGGRLVANAVTIEGEQVLTSAYSRLGGSLTRIAISRAEPVGPFSGWRPLMPVTQLALLKT